MHVYCFNCLLFSYYLQESLSTIGLTVHPRTVHNRLATWHDSLGKDILSIRDSWANSLVIIGTRTFLPFFELPSRKLFPCTCQSTNSSSAELAFRHPRGAIKGQPIHQSARLFQPQHCSRFIC